MIERIVPYDANSRLLNEFDKDNLVLGVKNAISCLDIIDQRMQLTTPTVKFVWLSFDARCQYSI